MKNQYVGDIGDYGKYALLRAFASHYRIGVNWYCQKARRNDAQWERTKKEMLTKVSDASIIVLTFHSIPQRSYIFVVHPCDKAKYRAIIDSFLQVWTGPFTEETV